MATKTLEERAQQRILDREVEAIKSEDGQRRIAHQNEQAKQKLGKEAQDTCVAALAARDAGLSEFIERMTSLCDLGDRLIAAKQRYERARSVAEKRGFTVQSWPRCFGVVRGGKVQADGTNAPLVGADERDLLQRLKAMLATAYGDL
jgi:hypothetical protein